jgi:uncharacterized protein YoxC
MGFFTIINIIVPMNSNILLTIILQSLAFAIGIFKIYNDVQVRMKELEMRLHAVEKQEDEIYRQLEKIFEAINEIKLDLKDKQNR